MTIAKYNGKCYFCKRSVSKGDEISFIKYPEGWKVVHPLCGVREEKPATPEAVELSNVKRLVELLATAKAAGLKFPKIVVEVDGVKLQFALAGPRSRYFGSVTVTDGGRFGANRWYGSINESGFYQPSNNADPAVIAAVEAFAADPEKVAGEHGHLTGNCCFCRLTLTDKRSTEVGYGPVCAEHFGLSWGSTKRAGFNPDKQSSDERFDYSNTNAALA